MGINSKNNHKQSKLSLYGLLAVFVLPMLFAIFLFYSHNYFHLPTLNHGDLISPPNKMLLSDYQKLNQNNSRNRWLVVFVAEICDERCQIMYHQLLQVQKALGANRERIAIIKIINSKNSTNKYFNLQQVYLVDPAGNVFMKYPVNTDPLNILQDLKKLLEVSQIG